MNNMAKVETQTPAARQIVDRVPVIWKGTNKDVENNVRTFETCQKRKIHQHRTPMQPLRISVHVFKDCDVCHLDESRTGTAFALSRQYISRFEAIAIFNEEVNIIVYR